MIVVSNVTYPPESTKEIAKRYLTAPPLPDFITKKGPYISASKRTGMHSLTYYELDNSRLAEGLQAIGDSLAIYFGVPGYQYEIKPYFELEEGLSILGL
ncbi:MULTISPECIES: hypothetical protein [Desulfotignum]|jgi:hypothetical protein|uniref:Uncharacterized protein n=1 Tax=Desulfotignum phosphitoxidans DSM 13687 TaxID=1286635 RepID=S0G2Z1_9BACT|nr:MULTISPECIES: hypothetical protein [Desulfotignum]EMS79829.1 hypothetical protein Dpo_4c03810 [Desulfotignum phosphitoxidans DSM 13687]